MASMKGGKLPLENVEFEGAWMTESVSLFSSKIDFN